MYIDLRRFGRKFMRDWIRILPLAFVLASTAAAQMPQSVPNGLPSWAYNIPDKVQPPTVKATGPVTVPERQSV